MPSRYDLTIVGLGSAGLTAAEFATRLGLRVAAVERDRIGGDCLWTGCVPSKALLAAAKVAHHMRTAHDFGIEPVEPRVDGARVMARVHAVRERIAAEDDSPERLRDELGVDLFEGAGRLTSPTTVQVGDSSLRSRHVLLCTGSRPAIPPVEGLEETGYLTSDSVWEIDDLPRSLVILGAGPIALEMAQAFRRLGLAITVLEREPRVLPREEQEAAERLLQILRDEGVTIHVGVEAERVTAEDGLKVVHAGGARHAAEQLVVATGRRPNVEGLGLEELGIGIGPRGVVTDSSLGTSVPTVSVAGDVAGRYLFTHSAGYEAVRALRNLAFPGTQSGDYAVPWVTFTDPELAHAGMTVEEARARFGPRHVEVHRHELARSDRARAEGSDRGLVLVVTHKGRIVGAHVLAPGAGELIHELALAMHRSLKLAQVGTMIHAYPTIGTEVGRLGADAAVRPAERLAPFVRLLGRARRGAG